MSHDRAEALADQVTRLRRELSLAEEGLANYAQEVERLTKERDKYKETLRICSRESERQLREENERLREALTKIAAYDPGKFRPLEDEIAIWRLATEGLSGHPGDKSGLTP